MIKDLILKWLGLDDVAHRNYVNTNINPIENRLNDLERRSEAKFKEAFKRIQKGHEILDEMCKTLELQPKEILIDDPNIPPQELTKIPKIIFLKKK